MRKSGLRVARLGGLLVFTCVLALLTSSGEAAIYLGRVYKTDIAQNTDAAALDYLLDDPAPGLIAKYNGSAEGPLAGSFTVTEADGTAFSEGTSLTAQWTLTAVPLLYEPIYYLLKVDNFRDVWQFDTATGDTIQDLGGGLFTYTSVALPTDPPGPYTQGISHASVFSEGAVPEPSTLIIWSLLGGLGLGVGWWRRKRAA